MIADLGDYARFHSLQVSYNTAVEHIEPKGAGQGFAVDTTAGLISCRYVVVATGLEVPHLPDIGGMEHVTGYEDMSRGGGVAGGPDAARPRRCPLV